MSPATRSSQLCCSDPESPRVTMTQDVLASFVGLTLRRRGPTQTRLPACAQRGVSYGLHTWPEPTLLVNARRSISNAMGIYFTRGIDSVVLRFKRRMHAGFSAHCGLTQRSLPWPCVPLGVIYSSSLPLS